MSKGDKREGESKHLPLYFSLQAVFVFLMKVRSSFLVWFRFLSFKGAVKSAFLFWVLLSMAKSNDIIKVKTEYCQRGKHMRKEGMTERLLFLEHFRDVAKMGLEFNLKPKKQADIIEP